MKIEAFLANATHIKELYVNSSRQWSSTPVKGYELKSREEILAPAASEKVTENEQEIKTDKRKKK